MPKLDYEIYNAYVECMLWSTLDDDGDPLDDNYDESDLAEETKIQATEDILDFIELCRVEGIDWSNDWTPEQFGHDFWLTRNGHGVGFWARDKGEIGDKLADLARTYGSCDPYVGDGGLIYTD